MNRMDLKGRSLLDVSDLTKDEILFLLYETKTAKKRFNRESPTAQLNGKSIALLFFEASTRTRTSFEMAAFRLGFRVLNLDVSSSSSQKGETIFDTARNINALSPHALIIRHSGSGVPLQISKIVSLPIINAGDGFHAHPTQALLDAFTMYEEFGEFKGLKVLIIGDIAHSRVARSNIILLKMLGAHVTVCGPPTLIPPFASELGVKVSDRLDECVGKADVVMCLRMQMERQTSFQVPSIKEYTTRYGLTQERVSKIQDKAIIMHPGPVNRGIEITSGGLIDERSRVLNQVENGVLMRAVILSELLGIKNER
jgi:aspartate carbamoyltransferase catalytic subunit